MEQRGREHNNWEELVEKAIDAKVKASLQPLSILCELDLRCPRGNQPAYSTVAMSQASFTLDPCDDPVKNSHRLRHRSRPTPRLPEAARPPTRRLGKRRKSIDVWINSETRVEKTLAPPLPPALTAGLGKTCPRSRASTVTRKDTTRGTALSPERTCQKTSISLGDFRSDD